MHKLFVYGGCSFSRPVNFVHVRVWGRKGRRAQIRTHLHKHVSIRLFGQLLINSSLSVANAYSEIYRQL
jgi:hypothetical protein